MTMNAILSRQETNDHRASSQWFSRPMDQRFTDLHSMYDACYASSSNPIIRNVETKGIRLEATTSDPNALDILIPGIDKAQLSHWSFGQLCGLIHAPASYLRTLPAALAAMPLQYGLINHREEVVKAYATQNGHVNLRALTGPQYGRIYDYEVVDAVRKLAGNGIGETNWRVPGEFGKQLAEVTKENTTLYASDRDCFIFLADESNKIEIGKLPNGDPDLVSRGFYVWNSEVGSAAFGIRAFLFRYVCCNRIIWGQSNIEELTFRHSAGAPERFAYEAAPMLEAYAHSSSTSLIQSVTKAKDAVVAKNDDERTEFLTRRGFTASQAAKVMEAVRVEEGHPADSVWDFVQGITAVARDLPHQDARVKLELAASKLMKKAA